MNSRGIATYVVYLVETQNMYADVAFDRATGKEDIEFRDRRFAMEISMGTIRNLITIDWIIEKCSSRKIKNIDSISLSILRTSIYQIKYMSSVPDYSAVNEAVVLTKKLKVPYASGFVNAILRRAVSIDVPNEISNLELDEASKLSFSHSLPLWIVELFISNYGLEGASLLCAKCNEDPSISIRLNRLKGEFASVLDKINEDGIKTDPGIYFDECKRAKISKGLLQHDTFQKGYFTMQDESSSFVAHIMDPKPGYKVMDVCAAPGGKATHIAELMSDEGYILACDINGDRVNMINENANRLGISSIETMVLDATDIPSKYYDFFDAVLVDAPCTGLGVLARRADSRWKKKPEDIIELAKIQRTILESASKCVAPGGVLIYSTCTDTPQENQNQIKEFLSNHPEYSPSPIKNLVGSIPLQEHEYMLQLSPHIHDVDGFFICRMEKNR